MTSPQEPTPIPVPTPVVTPTPDSRLDQVTAEWARLKPQLEELTKRVDELSKAIKTETMAAAPEGSSEVILRHPSLDTPYRVHPVETWRLDSKSMKAADPVAYVRWSKKSTSWRLDPVK